MPCKRVLALVGAFLASWTNAATFTVNTTAVDLGDLNPGDGICAWATFPPPDQRCTLRAAIMEANALSGADTIVLPFSVGIVLANAGIGEDAAATGDLDITAPLTITTPTTSSPGLRPVIDADQIDRVFDIRPGAGAVTFFNLVITNGRASSANSFVGGGIQVGNNSNLTLTSTSVTANIANAGAGIFSSGRLTLQFSEINANAVFEFGFTNAFGSAIKDPDSLPDAAAAVIIRNSSIYNNTSFGGQVRAAVQLRTPLTVENSTFSNNLPDAIRVFGTSATLNHVTITGSQTGYAFNGISIANSSALSNTIIAQNSSGDCSFLGSYSFAHNYTLAGDASCQLGGFGVGNLPNSNALLKPLALRRGNTPVHDLRPGSPAIDRGDPMLQGAGGTCIGSDQDQVPRPQDGDGGGARCDMGAIEYIDLIFRNGFESQPS